MEERRTKFENGGITANGTARPVYAGEVHYFRVAPDRWRPIFESMASAGFTAVSTVVPWSVHEERPGRYRWSGQLDLARFAEEAAAAGLMLIAKPGPQCGGELNFMGLPERVISASDNLAVTGRGTPAWIPQPPRMFPLPSYAASGFITAARGWLAAVGRVLGDFEAPDGPLVALGLDNHLGSFYRSAAFDIDYHPEALEWWNEHSGGLEAPRAWDGDRAADCARWVEFKEVYVARAMTWVSAAIDDAGLSTVARFHNAPPVAPGNVSALRVSGHTDSLPAWDIYQLVPGFDHMRELGRYLAGSTPVAFASALGCGSPAYLPPAAPTKQRSAAIATLGAGVRGFSISMLESRDRWSGAASELGQGDWVRPLVEALSELEWSTLRVEAPVAVVESRADRRFGVASSMLGPVTPQLSGLVSLGAGGFAEFGRDAGARITARWQRNVREALEAFDIPFVVLDEAAPYSRFSEFKLIVCPTHERIDEGLWSKLSALAGGGTRVILGPGQPSKNAFDEPLADSDLSPGMGLLRTESRDDLDALGADLAAAAGELDDDWIAEGASCTVHRDRGGRARALVIVNAGDAKRVQIAVPPGTTLTALASPSGDAACDQSHRDSAGGVVELDLAAESAALFAIE